MRATQFWILLLGSSFVSVLFIKQIFLSRALDQEHRLFVDSQETVSTGPGYEDSWQHLAVHIYQASRQDPALAQVLKNANVDVHANSVAGAAPPTSSKTPAAPIHPAAP